MPSMPTEEVFKTKVILLLGAKKDKSETKWQLGSKAGWHLSAETRNQWFADLVREGYLNQYRIEDMLKPGRRPVLFELTTKGVKRYREEAKNHRRRIPI